MTPLPKQPLPAVPAAGRSLTDRDRAAKRTPIPLISAGKARGILAPLASSPVAGEAVDIDALLQRIAFALPLIELPRLTVWTLRHGVQVLVDCSPALLPLGHDVEQVEAQLRSVVGKERLQRLYFAGCPSRGVGAGARDGWSVWRPPRLGKVAIVLSDLGCAGSIGNPEWASPEEWGRFADRAREAGTLLVALVPYPVHRVPAALTRAIAIVPWHEQLDAGRAQRVLRDARASVGS